VTVRSTTELVHGRRRQVCVPRVSRLTDQVPVCASQGALNTSPIAKCMDERRYEEFTCSNTVGLDGAVEKNRDVLADRLKTARGQGAPIPVQTRHAVNYANLYIEPLQKLLYQI